MSQSSQPIPAPGAAGPRRSWNPLAAALWANAALLGLILIFLVSRHGPGSLLPAAFGEEAPSIAGGGGIYVMPAQLALNQWGCYLLDIDNKTLLAYQYSPHDHKLTFVAARTYKWDTKLHDYNTDPPTKDIAKLIEMENQSRNAAPVPGQNPEPAPEAPKP